MRITATIPSRIIAGHRQFSTKSLPLDEISRGGPGAINQTSASALSTFCPKRGASHSNQWLDRRLLAKEGRREAQSRVRSPLSDGPNFVGDRQPGHALRRADPVLRLDRFYAGGVVVAYVKWLQNSHQATESAKSLSQKFIKDYRAFAT